MDASQLRGSAGQVNFERELRRGRTKMPAAPAATCRSMYSAKGLLAHTKGADGLGLSKRQLAGQGTGDPRHRKSTA